MIGNLVSMRLDRGLVIETVLDPKQQPFLHDHQIEGTPVLPGVMGIEAFAEAAQSLLPNWRIDKIEDVTFQAPFKFYRQDPRTLTIETAIRPHGDGLLACCRLNGRRTLANQTEPQITTHFTARVQLTKQSPELSVATLFTRPSGPAVESKDIYRAYFHGPAYQVLERAWLDESRVIGLFAADLPQNHQPPSRPLLTAPRLVELCFQTAGLWEMATKGHMGLPFRIRQLTLLQLPNLSSAPFYAVVTPDHDSFNAEVVDTKGNVYLRLDGYVTVPLPGVVNTEALKTLQEAMSLHAIAV
jgi:hypothetical protein